LHNSISFIKVYSGKTHQCHQIKSKWQTPTQLILNSYFHGLGSLYTQGNVIKLKLIPSPIP